MAKIILAGASGLTGGQLLPLLCGQGHDVTVISRRALTDAPQGAQQIVAPPHEWAGSIAGRKFDMGISCLGSTIKKAGSQAAFRAVDCELLRDYAAAAKNSGVQHFITISSTMADSSARSFYLKTKGEAEDALRANGFDRLDIIRPGLLKGPRQEFRLGERMGIVAAPLLDRLLRGNMRKFRSIETADVASAVAALTGQKEAGVYVHHNSELLVLAAR